MAKQKINKLVDFGAYYSMIAYLLAAIIKIGFGLFYNSSALYTDGLNSSSDVIATVIILVGLKFSRKPKDAEHQYGHHRIEQIATLIAAFIMLFIGGQSLLQAIEKIFSPDLTPPNISAAWIAGISIILLTSSAVINMRIAKKTKVQSASVIAKNNLSDCLTAIGALIAIIAAQWQLSIIDPIVSLIIACVIIYTGIDIFRQSSNSLIDGFDTKTLKKCRATIAQTPGVKAIIDISGRMLGNIEVLEVSIAVNGRLSVLEGHDIADTIERELKQQHGIEHTHVHIEPDICDVPQSTT